MKSGRIWKFNDNIDTDQIIASQYLLLPTIDQMKAHTFEGIIPGFTNYFSHGDVMITGENFGCGSSREQAPRVLKAIGVGAVIGNSFARIFFRNSINIGLPLIQCQGLHGNVTDGDSLSYDIEGAVIHYKGRDYRFNHYPEHILKIIRCGGLIPYINQF